MAMAVTPNPTAPSFRLGAGSPFVAGIGTLTFSGNYSTGGESADFAVLHATGSGNQPHTVIFTPNPVAGYTLEYDLANKKVKALREADAAGAMVEIAAAAYPVALAAIVVRYEVHFLAA